MPLAKSSRGIEELVDENSGKEVVATPVVVNRFEDLMKEYEQYFNDTFLRQNVEEVLLPCDLNLFLQQTRNYENNPHYQTNTGLFISQLIQNSYDAGNNEFVLDVHFLKPINFLAYNVSGTEERKVRAVVKGEVGNFCMKNAQHSIFTIGTAGNWCGEDATYSTFTIEKAGVRCGRRAQHSIFTIEETGDWCGEHAHHSNFKTHNQQQYEQFKEYVSRSQDNTLYLLSSTGSILKGGPW